MAKLLGTIPGFWYYNLQDTEMKGSTFNIYSRSGIEAYYDCYGEIPRADPVVLDSAGVAITYLDADEDHSLFISDAGGTPINTVLGVTGIPNPSLVAANINMNGNSIVSSSNGDISITPDGPGSVILDGLHWLTMDGASGQLISTDGEGRLGAGGFSFTLSGDSTPQLGGDLDTNSHNIKINNARGSVDDSDNEQLLFSKTTDAVNYTNIASAATGNGPTISPAGDDSNIDLNINSKGVSNVVLSGYKLPANDGASDYILKTDGAGTVSFTEKNSFVASAAPMASQSEMETADTEAKFVSPSNLKWHPAVAKAWCLSSGTNGSGAPAASYNIASHSATVEGNAGYEIDFNFDVTMANTNYAVIATTGIADGGHFGQMLTVRSRSTTGCTLRTITTAGASRTTTRLINVTIFGELA
jgi:hypothetical protein